MTHCSFGVTRVVDVWIIHGHLPGLLPNLQRGEVNQTVRSGGSFGLTLLNLRQDTIEFVDPAIPEVPFVMGVAGVGPAEIDFAGRWERHDLKPGLLDIQPPSQSCGPRQKKPPCPTACWILASMPCPIIYPFAISN